jgi:hypothetical protein
MWCDDGIQLIQSAPFISSSAWSCPHPNGPCFLIGSALPQALVLGCSNVPLWRYFIRDLSFSCFLWFTPYASVRGIRQEALLVVLPDGHAMVFGHLSRQVVIFLRLSFYLQGLPFATSLYFTTSVDEGLDVQAVCLSFYIFFSFFVAF